MKLIDTIDTTNCVGGMRYGDNVVEFWYPSPTGGQTDSIIKSYTFDTDAEADEAHALIRTCYQREIARLTGVVPSCTGV